MRIGYIILLTALVVYLCMPELCDACGRRRRRRRISRRRYIRIRVIRRVRRRSGSYYRDRTRPSLRCPSSITAVALPRQTYARASWVEPLARDNRDGTIRPTRRGPGPNSIFYRTTRIVYEARDRARNFASCAFYVIVRVVRCPRPEAVEHGYYSFSPGSDFRYGGTLTYSCWRGYELSGHSTSQCLRRSGYIGQWSASPPLCQRVTCPVLPSVQRGRIECSDANRFESECTYACDEGYSAPPGVGSTRICNHNRAWLGSQPTCIDTQPPMWHNCPSNMIAYTHRGSNRAVPTWLRPTAADNSGEDISVTLRGGFEPGTSVEVGSYEIRYTASDGAGNVASDCRFVVDVRQVSCPRIHPTLNQLISCPDGYDWGDSCTLSCEEGYELEGRPEATCEASGTPPVAYWSYGLEQPTCEGRSCPPLRAPANGSLACDLWLFGSFCKMFCRSGYQVPRTESRAAQNLFVCGEDGGWGDEVPDCSPEREGSRRRSRVAVNYAFTGDCCDPAVQLSIQQQFIDILSRDLGFSEACLLHPDDCTVGNVQVTCNPGCGQGGDRRKRADSRGRRSAEQFVLHIEGEVAVPIPSAASAVEGSAQAADWLDGFVQGVRQSGSLNDVQVEGGETELMSVDSTQPEVECEVGFRPTENGVCAGCEPGSYYSAETDSCVRCPRGTYHDDGSDVICVPCADGQSTARDGAQTQAECQAICGAGSYSATGVAPCTPCIQGTYASAMGARQCDDCPLGTSTEAAGSTSASQCHAFGINVPNIEGAASYVQLDTSLSEAAVLALSLKVYIDAASSTVTLLRSQIGQDIELLLNADLTCSIMLSSCEFTIVGDHHLQLRNWNALYAAIDLAGGRVVDLYLNDQRLETASVCESGGLVFNRNMTVSFGKLNAESGFSGKFSDVNLWNNSLSEAQITSRNGQCLPALYGNVVAWNDFKDAQLVGAAFEVPTSCEVLNSCSSGPCGSHSCVDGVSSYQCNCDAGFTGEQCETDVYDCVQHSCDEGSSCVDDVNGYSCQCPPERRGRYCELEIVHGGWSDWNEWGECSATCEGGLQTRERTCTQPEPGEGGNTCPGLSAETLECNAFECPVCMDLTAPVNGQLLCDGDVTDSINCTVECNTGYAFSVEPLPYYFCDANTTSFTWDFHTEDNPNAQLPGCVEISPPADMVSDHVVFYDDMYCSERNYQAHGQTVRDGMQTIDCVSSGVCTWDMQVNNCDEEDRRTRRSEDPMSMNLYLRINETLLPSNASSQELVEVYDPLVDELVDAALDLMEALENGTFTVYVDDDVYIVTGQNVTPVVECESRGYVYEEFYCMACERGTYEEELTCYSCDYGSYQDQSGQISCLPCPDGYTTPGRGSSSADNCTVRLEVSVATTTTENPSPQKQTQKEESSEGGSLALAVALPVVLAVVIAITTVIAFKLYKAKRSAKENSSKTVRDVKPMKPATPEPRDPVATAEEVKSSSRPPSATKTIAVTEHSEAAIPETTPRPGTAVSCTGITFESPEEQHFTSVA